jgi:hypothetical protein
MIAVAIIAEFLDASKRRGRLIVYLWRQTDEPVGVGVLFECPR